MGVYTSNLNDDFNRHDGAMVGYYAADQLTTVTPRHHYDLRAFHASTIPVPFTQLDYNFWHNFNYNSLNPGDTRNISLGVENWDNGSFGKNVAYRYSNSLSLVVTDASTGDSVYGTSVYGTAFYGAASSATSSTYADDILTDFNVPGHTYYIELVLRNFPAQASSTHFDLSNSFIDISSSPTFVPAVTDSLAFSSSLNDVSAGGDTFLRFPRTLLTKANLTSIQGVRFRMRSIGINTLVVQAMRLIADDYSYQLIDLDTKKERLVRSVPRAGGAESLSTFGDVYFKNEQPKNTTYITLFNSGHNPSGNDNTYRQFFRTKANGDRIEIKLNARDTQSRLFIIQTVGGVTTTIFSTSTLTNILLPETFYYLVSEVNGTQVRATIYQTNGISLGTQLYTTGFQTTTLAGQGLVGYSFEPYNYDFNLLYVAPQTTEFAVFQSTAMNSRKLVRGATLYPVASNVLDIFATDTFVPVAWGDATVTTDANNDLNITRSGTLTQGGVKYTPLTFYGNTAQLDFHGFLWTTNPQGSYRVALINATDSVEWLTTLTGILPNQWNEFTIPVTPGILPDSSYLVVQQLGTYSGSFKLRDIGLLYKSISWNLSSDNGATWQPALDAINYEFSGVMFPTPSTTIKVQAVANTDQGWIEGYQLIPRYVY